MVRWLIRNVSAEMDYSTLTAIDVEFAPPKDPKDVAGRVRKFREKQGKRRPENRRMIAWDGEGINLSGDGKPQHYVLFGCSARVDDPLMINNPEQDLDFYMIADYMLKTAEMFPRSFHIGYGFGYDQNMIIKSLRWTDKLKLYTNGEVWIRRGRGIRYKVQWVPKKMISITKVIGRGDARTSSYIKVEDIVSFYAAPFVKAYEKTFPDIATDSTWQEILVRGKELRGQNKWENFPDILKYWKYEILAMERLATGLRDLMWDNGFYLLQWYGPGAFANYLRRTYKLVDHEWGGKQENLPNDSVHTAIKCAYYGGHFEQFQGGHVRDTVYGYDINSAYPAAFCYVPSMAEGGFWQELLDDDAAKDAIDPSSPMTVYYVRFKGRVPGQHSMFQTRPMPLPWRDERGSVSYPPMVEGWYWSPEVKAVLESQRWNNEYSNLEITRAFRWVAANDTFPWKAMIEPMYERRLELKREKNPAEMVFKLGPNSLYGKMAQRVGYNEETFEPPKAHTLCIAGFLTSWCRAMILRIMDAMDDDQIIAVETDGIYSTATPEQVQARWPDIKFSKALGEWGMDIYDEVIYLQNGVYLKLEKGEWAAKTRGINASALTYERVTTYAEKCKAGEQWEPMLIDNGNQFLGLGLAVLRSTDATGTVISAKAGRMHCVWYPDTKEIIPTGAASSKRAHHPKFCNACKMGMSLNDGLHTLHIHMRGHKGLGYKSHPYRLPWETKEKEQWRDQIGATSDRKSDVSRVPSRVRHQSNRVVGKSLTVADIMSSLESGQFPKSETA